jgi:hypothetical protein
MSPQDPPACGPQKLGGDLELSEVAVNDQLPRLVADLHDAGRNVLDVAAHVAAPIRVGHRGPLRVDRDGEGPYHPLARVGEPLHLLALGVAEGLALGRVLGGLPELADGPHGNLPDSVPVEAGEIDGCARVIGHRYLSDVGGARVGLTPADSRVPAPEPLCGSHSPVPMRVVDELAGATTAHLSATPAGTEPQLRFRLISATSLWVTLAAGGTATPRMP